MHSNTRSHTDGGLSMVRVFNIVSPTKHNLDTISSTETEIISVDYCMPAILWNRYFLETQGYDVFGNILYQNSKSSIILERMARLQPESAQRT